MIRPLLRFLLVLGVAVSPAWAQPRPFEGRSGDLAARLILVDDLPGFWRAWRGPPPLKVRETNTVTTTKAAHAVLLFVGCKAGADGKCNVGVTYTITGPDKRAYGKPVSGTAYTGPPSKGTKLLASPGALSMKLDNGDKPGPYLIQAVVKDRVSGATVTLRRGALGGVPRKAVTT